MAGFVAARPLCYHFFVIGESHPGKLGAIAVTLGLIRFDGLGQKFPPPRHWIGELVGTGLRPHDLINGSPSGRLFARADTVAAGRVRRVTVTAHVHATPGGKEGKANEDNFLPGTEIRLRSDPAQAG